MKKLIALILILSPSAFAARYSYIVSFTCSGAKFDDAGSQYGEGTFQVFILNRDGIMLVDGKRQTVLPYVTTSEKFLQARTTFMSGGLNVSMKADEVILNPRVPKKIYFVPIVNSQDSTQTFTAQCTRDLSEQK